MTGYVLRRLLAMIPVLFAISFLAFAALHLTPGDAASISLAARTGIDTPPEQAVADVRREMRLEDPLLRQYFRWLTGVLSGDLGRSYQTGRPVFQELAQVLPASACLAGAALLVDLLLAVPAGVAAALKRGRPVDHLTLCGSLLFGCIPDFFLGILLILLFSIVFRLTPVAGFSSPSGIILPALTLGLTNAAVAARLLRAGMLQSLEEKHLVAARARGLSRRAVVWKHALRQALTPMTSYLGAQFGYFFGGAVVVETVFAWPGLGRLLVESINARDRAVVQGCVLAIAALYVCINLAVDILQWILDPRTRHA
jgi:ABC-type dipeptide/oligopeptide/nickel transport system permease component